MLAFMVKAISLVVPSRSMLFSGNMVDVLHVEQTLEVSSFRHR